MQAQYEASHKAMKEVINTSDAGEVQAVGEAVAAFARVVQEMQEKLRRHRLVRLREQFEAAAKAYADATGNQEVWQSSARFLQMPAAVCGSAAPAPQLPPPDDDSSSSLSQPLAMSNNASAVASSIPSANKRLRSGASPYKSPERGQRVAVREDFLRRLAEGGLPSRAVGGFDDPLKLRKKLAEGGLESVEAIAEVADLQKELPRLNVYFGGDGARATALPPSLHKRLVQLMHFLREPSGVAEDN